MVTTKYFLLAYNAILGCNYRNIATKYNKLLLSLNIIWTPQNLKVFVSPASTILLNSMFSETSFSIGPLLYFGTCPYRVLKASEFTYKLVRQRQKNNKEQKNTTDCLVCNNALNIINGGFRWPTAEIYNSFALRMKAKTGWVNREPTFKFVSTHFEIKFTLICMKFKRWMGNEKIYKLYEIRKTLARVHRCSDASTRVKVVRPAPWVTSTDRSSEQFRTIPSQQPKLCTRKNTLFTSNNCALTIAIFNKYSIPVHTRTEHVLFPKNLKDSINIVVRLICIANIFKMQICCAQCGQDIFKFRWERILQAQKALNMIQPKIFLDMHNLYIYTSRPDKMLFSHKKYFKKNYCTIYY